MFVNANPRKKMIAKPLSYFLRRSQVLNQYRRMLRAAKRPDMRDAIKETYRRHQHEQDPFTIKGLLAEGRRQLQQLEALSEDPKHYRDQYPVGTGWPWELKK